jgi:hypothetical protein
MAAGLVLVVAAFGAGSVAALVPASASGSAVPFTDPNQRGYIALCDLNGHNVAGGSINTTPLVWKAVASAPAPSGYRGKGENAALFIYQARQDTPTAEWSGDTLSADTFYYNAKHPAAEMTYKDLSLADIIHEFPPLWDGLYELRMQVGKLNFATYSATYPATVIKVTGNTWHVVRGGTLPCGGSTRAKSAELLTGGTLTNPKSDKGETPTTAPESVRAVMNAASASSGGQGGAVATVSQAADSSDGSSSSSSDTTAIVVVVVAAVVIAGLGGGLLWRRRSTGSMS